MRTKQTTSMLWSAVTLAVMVALAGWTGVARATVTALGEDTTTSDAWRTPSVTKNTVYDQNGDGLYGSDGYYVGVGDPDKTNMNGGSPYLQSLPSYISNFAYSSASAGGPIDGSSAIDNPVLNSGANLNTAAMLPWFDYVGGTDGAPVLLPAFTFKLTRNERFVLTAIGDVWNSLRWNPLGVTVSNQTTHAVATQTFSLTNGSKPDYAFFAIDGQANDQFTVFYDTVVGNYGTSGGCMT